MIFFCIIFHMNMQAGKLLDGDDFNDANNIKGLVIALIGPEKVGKSTLVNNIYKDLTGEDLIRDNSTTLGIDYITFKHTYGDITILDCQGIGLNGVSGKSNDLDILIMAFYIADLFVCVNRGEITSNTFKGINLLDAHGLDNLKQRDSSFILFCIDYPHEDSHEIKSDKYEHTSALEFINKLFKYNAAIVDSKSSSGIPLLIDELNKHMDNPLPTRVRYLIGRNAAINSRTKTQKNIKPQVTVSMKNTLSLYRQETLELISKSMPLIDGTTKDDSIIISIQENTIKLLDKFNRDFDVLSDNSKYDCIKLLFLDLVNVEFRKLLSLSELNSKIIEEAKLYSIDSLSRLDELSSINEISDVGVRYHKVSIIIMRIYLHLYSTCSKHYRQTNSMADDISIDKLYDLRSVIVDNRSKFGRNYTDMINKLAVCNPDITLLVGSSQYNISGIDSQKVLIKVERNGLEITGDAH